MSQRKIQSNGAQPIDKAPTGIPGLDEITQGGLPRGRPTLVCGSAGCGKTLLAMEFLVRGATQFGEPGVFVSFEEAPEEIAVNVRSLGFDVPSLIQQKKLLIDHVRLDRGGFEEAGEYDLEGLFVRLAYAIDQVKAKRVALDTIETLFAGLSNEGILRAELVRLFRWLKEKGVTAVITGERGEGTLTRHGLEEYVSDCVILLDHRVNEQVSTRRMRIVKYRGSTHGTNEYPFLIDARGFSVLPVTSLGLAHQIHNERISSGIGALDQMLGGAGYYRGSSVLVSGTAGTGKTSLSAHFADACCRRGEKVLYLAFEESPDQIIRNMASIGLNLDRWVKKRLLHFHANRPSLQGLEMHLVQTHRLVEDLSPSAVIVDPMSSLLASGDELSAHNMLLRLVDFLKARGATGFFTSLTDPSQPLEATGVAVSSVMDTWLLLRDVESSGERNRVLYVLKSRGMAHSHQLREFRITGEGIKLFDVYVGPDGVLTGSARLAQEARETAAKLTRERDIERKRRELERKRAALQAQIAILHEEFAAEEQEVLQFVSELEDRERVLSSNEEAMGALRGANRNGSERGRRGVVRATAKRVLTEQE